MGIASQQLHPPASTRKDLFGLSATILSANSNQGSSLRWLSDLGFAVRAQDAGHWIVTHTTPLPELHFYSEQELEQFARYRAHNYAKHLLQENCA